MKDCLQKIRYQFVFSGIMGLLFILTGCIFNKDASGNGKTNESTEHDAPFVQDTLKKIASLETCAARLVGSLGKEQKNNGIKVLDTEERYDWTYTPGKRAGISLGEMNAEQKKLAYRLLRVSLSSGGYKKARGIIKLEDILRKLENRPKDDEYRDKDKYYWTFYGNPRANGEKNKQADIPWAWSISGHHLSLHFTVFKDTLISGTPFFMGTHPAEIPFGPYKGMKVLDAEEESAFKLLKALNKQQKEQAIISDDPPYDIVSGTGKRPENVTVAGLPYHEMNASQQALFKDLISVYIDRYPEKFSDHFMQNLKANGLGGIHFGWWGGRIRSEKHYYRISGKRIWIEYENARKNTNHVHTVVRERKNDFGRSWLKKHHEEHDH